MIVDWEGQFQIVSQYGSIDLNLTSGDRYLLNRAACDAGADLRVANTNIPSADGAITHDVFSSWYAVDFSCSLWVNSDPACGQDMVRMVDNLSKIVLGARHADGRIYYTPSGYPQRLLNNVRLTTKISHTISNLGRVGEGEGRMSVLTWQMASPYPYTQVAAQICTHVAAGATTNFANVGTTEFYPVIHVYGPTTGGFNIQNLTTGKELLYSPTLPGAVDIPAGQSIELDFFRDTAYFGPAPSSACAGDGGPWTGNNAKNGIQIAMSDFFPITPVGGGNNIKITGAAMDVLWQSAYG